MPKGIYQVPIPRNEPILSYAPGSDERRELQEALAQARASTIDIPMYIGHEEIHTNNKVSLHPPHDHQHLLGHFSEGDSDHVVLAINAALGAKHAWAKLSWEHRASIFLKAADLIAGPIVQN